MKLVLLGPLMRRWCRPRVEGAHHIPVSGGAVLASNHLAVADSFYLMLMVRRQIFFLAKREYFTQPGVVGWIKRQFFTGLGQVPIDRGRGSSARATLDTAVRLLRENRLMGVYPEGTRSPDGLLYKGKTGIARMVLEAEVPVIPVAMVGTDRVNPIGSTIWRPRKIRIKIGEPLDFSRYHGMENDRHIHRAVTDEITYALMELSGAEYVDIYAAKAKQDAEHTEGERAAASRLSRRQAS